MGRRKAQGPSVSFFAFQDIITSVVGIFVLITLIMLVDLVTRKASASSAKKFVEDTYSSAIADLELQLQELQSQSSKLDAMSAKVGNVQVFNKEEVAKDLKASIQSLNQQIERTEKRNQEVERVIDAQNKVLSDLQVEVHKKSPDREELAKLLKQLEKLDSKVGDLDLEELLIFRNQSLEWRPVMVVEISSNELSILDLGAEQRTTYKGLSLAKDFESFLRANRSGKYHYFLLIRPGGAKTFSEIRPILDTNNASYGYDVLEQNRSLKLRSEVLK
jgi:myosin heavy subunit